MEKSMLALRELVGSAVLVDEILPRAHVARLELLQSGLLSYPVRHNSEQSFGLASSHDGLTSCLNLYGPPVADINLSPAR
jgi:hypothetical protein